MYWLIINVIATCVSIFMFGLSFEKFWKKEKDSGFSFAFYLFLAAFFMGASVLTTHGYTRGSVTYPAFIPEDPIFAVAGQVETSKGPVVIIEDGEYNIYCVWAKVGEDKFGLPPEAKFVRRMVPSGAKNPWPWVLEPVEVRP